MQLNAKTTALVLIDLQTGVLARPLLPHPTWGAFYGTDLDLQLRRRG
jgi:nicotinamidase-related amidase